MPLFSRIYYFFCGSDDLREVVNLLKKQGKQIQTIMANFQEFKDELTAIKTLLLKVDAEQKKLIEKIETQGLANLEEAEVLADLKAIRAGLAAIDDQVADPETPVEPA